MRHWRRHCYQARFDFFGIADVGVASFLGIGGGPINLVVIFNKKISSKAVDRLFTAFMSLVIFISIYNALKFVP